MTKQTLPSVAELTHLIEDAMSGGLHPSVIQRLSVLRYFVQYRPTVSELCRHFGISRSTFHRWIERFDSNDVLSLQDRSQDGQLDHHPTVSPEAIELIRRYRREAPLLGKERIASFLRQQHGITVSASTVGRVIDRECLYFAETPLHWKKRVELGGYDRSLTDERSATVEPSIYPMEKTVAAVMPDLEVSTESHAAGSVVHVHVPGMTPLGTSFSGFMKFVVVSSVLINIIFISMLVGMAFFEQSTRSTDPRMDAAERPAVVQQNEVLHGAFPDVLIPK
jgi:transposase-like protein